MTLAQWLVMIHWAVLEQRAVLVPYEEWVKLKAMAQSVTLVIDLDPKEFSTSNCNFNN